MGVEYRRHQNNLIMIGHGVIWLSVWSIVKIILEFTIGRDRMVELYIRGYLGGNATKGDELVMTVVTFVVYMVVYILVFLLHYYIGRSAINEALGRGKRKFDYLVVVIIAIMIYGLNLLNYRQEFLENKDVLRVIFNLVMDITLIIFYVELIVSTREIRKIRAKACKEAEEE